MSRELSGPYSAVDFNTSTGWWDERSGTIYDVYAGAMGDDPAEGVVVVLTRPAGSPGSHALLRYFAMPADDGPLTMTGSRRWDVWLRARDGRRFFFDVLEDRLVATSSRR